MYKCKFLVLFSFSLALSLTACQNKTQSTQEAAAEKSCCASEGETKAYSPEKILADGSSLVNQTIQLQGTVTHVCKHSGKKCFLQGANPEASVQVMAGGDIASFDKELIGSEITVTGTVKEHRIQRDVIEKQEKAVQAEMSKEGCTEMERCSRVMSNVKEMKQWMADNQKDYYPVYYVEGARYEVAQ